MTTKERLSASVDAELLAAGQQAVVEGRADNLSAWVNEALRQAVERDRKLQAMDRFLAAYEAEHGVITDEEMATAVRQARARAIVVRGSAGPGLAR